MALGVVGDVGATIQGLLPLLGKVRNGAHLAKAQADYVDARDGLDALATGNNDGPIHPQRLTRMLSEAATDDAVFTFDVGTVTVWAARYLRMNGRRRLLGSLNHGSMANALPQAIGAQCAAPGRQVISLSGDGGFAMLMGEFLTLTQQDLPVKLVVYNNGSLGFVALEMRGAGLLEFGTDLKNPDFAAVARAAGAYGRRVVEPGDLDNAVREFLAHPGPALLDVLTYKQELAMPPTITAGEVKGFGLWTARAVLNGRGDEVVALVRRGGLLKTLLG